MIVSSPLLVTAKAPSGKASMPLTFLDENALALPAITTLFAIPSENVVTAPKLESAATKLPSLRNSRSEIYLIAALALVEL